MNLHVISPGPLTTVQDAGRTGYAARGFRTCGAADGYAMRIANLLAGNPQAAGAAVLEMTLQGGKYQFDGDAVFALAGADMPAALDGRPVPAYTPLLARAGWFFAETANQVLSQVKYAPTGVDEQAGILLMNPAGEMATVTLSLHAKQPKRATIAFDKGYIEIFEYPRAMEATITYTGDGHKETISAGETADALSYEVADMEAAVCSGDLSTIESLMHLNYSQDVMHIMTEIRNNWGMKYPEEE